MSYIIIVLISSLRIPRTSAEGVNSDNQPKTVMSKQEEKSNLYSEYQRAQEELWQDYQKLRDQLIKEEVRIQKKGDF
jgi:hypothetical protein